jgi:threonyl-tRNA synthetase
VTLNDDKAVIHKTWEVLDKAKGLGLRVELDNSNESVGKKIRNAELMKVPYTVVIGGKEAESNQLSPRIRADLGSSSMAHSVKEFLAQVANEAKSRATKTTL